MIDRLRAIRDREGRRTVQRRDEGGWVRRFRRHRPGGGLGRGGRGRSRLAPGARHVRLPASRRALVARPRGAPARPGRRGPRRVDRALARPSRLPVARARRRRAAGRRGLLRAARPRQGADRRAGRAARLPARALPGNWFPHRLRDATEDGVFFVGDSAGHCFPLSGEGIRTAFYFGIACGRELRDVLAGAQSRERALERYAAFSARHERAFRRALQLQRLIPALPPRVLTVLLRAMSNQRLIDRSFGWYLDQAHPSFANQGSPATPSAALSEGVRS